jgi:type VI secretion system protein ImpF
LNSFFFLLIICAMAKIQAEQPLVPSVLDRLLDDDPTVSRDPPARQRHQGLSELKEAVRRDLENLLNTRRRCLPCPDDLTDLKQSLVQYGLPDFLAAGSGSAEGREDVRRFLESVIRVCEPRFQTVKVHMLTNVEPLDRTLRFRIDGLLRVEPSPEPVVFDSALEPGTGTFEIKGVSA